MLGGYKVERLDCDQYQPLTASMPGHQDKFHGPEPDPSPWLAVSHHIKETNKAKPYDPKKSVWVPCLKTGGYLEGLTTDKTGSKVSVLVNGEVKTFKEDQVCQVNPPKFDCTEDMANLTYLGDGCILHNSVVRYVNQLIYTYSGNFQPSGVFLNIFLVQVSSVLPSIRTRDFPSTPSGPSSCTLASGGTRSLLTSSPYQRRLTRE